jgi:integrase/recombinase XerD
MRSARSLRSWDAAVAAFLSSGRALGRGYRVEEYVLRKVRKFLVRAGACDLDQRLFDRFRARYYGHSSSTRVAIEHIVYRFHRYRRRTEPRCFLPDRESLARQEPQPLPTLVGRDQIARLLGYVSTLGCECHPLRPAVLRMALVLLYTAGLRRGELIRLTLADVDECSGVLRIRESKFHKSRWVPLSPSATMELRQYLEARAKAGFDQAPNAPLLVSRRARAYQGSGIGNALRKMFAAADIRDRSGRRPRVQDLRHSFAVAALLRWYEAGADVQANLPKLALYMGHVSIKSTAYYLRCMPAVVRQAGKRFMRSWVDVLDGGRS